MESRKDMLRRTALLAHAPNDMLEELSNHAIEKHYRHGEFVFHEGAPSSCLYVIVQGVVDIMKLSDGGNVVIGQLSVGQPIGEMGLLEDLPRSAGIRAASAEIVLLELKKEHVIGPLNSQPQILHEAVKLFSERLRTSNNELQRKYAELADANRRLRQSYNATLLALSHALDLRDHSTEGHSHRVTSYSLLIGEAMKLDHEELEALRLGALLHDIGKIGIPDAILRKPGKLTNEEWGEMRKHPVWGKGIIEDIDFLSRAADVIYAHHEKWNGQGYPQNLKGDQIPLGARIFAIADVFDALTMERPYKDAWPPSEARDEIVRGAGTHFDPVVVDVFAQVFPQFIEVMEKSKAGQLIPYFSAALV